MPNTFTLQVNRRDPRPRSPRLRSLGSGSTSGSAMPGGQIPADIAQQISAAIAALTERIASAYLSKLHDDVAAGRITFEQGLRALQTVNIEAADLVITSGEDGGGNIEADGDISAGGDLDVSGAAVIGGNTTIGGFIGSPSFATGLLGHGWRIGGPNNNGHGELDSLTLRRFLEVPELRYNRTEVHVGVDWHTHGAGLIEDVIHPDGFTQNRGIIKLKLEDGEVGAVAKDDYCMGIFHDEATPSNNYQPDPQQEETPVQDSHNGNFKFAGFMTVYFKVVDICDASGDTSHPDSRNQYFIYELRPESSVAGKEWHHSFHPQPSMSFACYANPKRSDRQSCIYSTTDYIIMLVGMTDWTYDGDNIAYIRGYLNGFTIPERHLVNGEWVDTGQYKTLSGYGIAFGKAYMWGSIEQFNRAPFLISQQLYQVALNIAPSVVLNNEDWQDDYDWSIEPQNPSPNAPYLYSYWLQTFSDNSTKIDGPYLSGYDNSLFTAVLNKDIISLALSDWYVDGNSTDVLDFDVDAKLLRGNEQIPIVNATATSTIAGFSVDTPVSIDQYDIAHFHLHITGFVPQQVENVLAENNYVTFRLYADQTNYAEHTLAVVENRQGDTGADGDDALLYTVESSLRSFSHTDSISIDFRIYSSVGGERKPYLAYPLLVEYDINGNIVRTPYAPSQVNAFLDWRPHDQSVVRADVLVFLDRASQIRYLGYISGAYQSYDVEPSAFTSVTLAEPVIDFRLSHEGSINYPLDAATRIPEENAFTVTAQMFANGVKLTLTDLDCQLSFGSTSTGITIANPGEAPNEQVDFETINAAVGANSTQMFTVTASAVYGGRTYTRSKTISFCAVSAGTYTTGDQGIQGCVIRPCGVWKAGERYVNESGKKTPTDPSGVRYIDVVQYEHNGTVKCYARTPYESGYQPGIDPASGTLYWTESSSFEFIATQLLLALNAQITFAQGNQILIMAEDGRTIVGGLSGFDINNPSAYRLWLGAQQPAEAPFSVTHQGALVAANINARFQDLSNCHSAGEQQSQQANEHYRKALNLDDIKNGTPVRDSNENQVSVLPRVYNFIANFCLVQLPTSSDYIGTRVLICNNDGAFGTGTVVVQQGRASFYGTPMLEVGTRTDPIISTPVTVIEFVGGVMEFIAVPHYYDSSKCTWALMSDASNIKYYNGEIQNFNYPDEE